MPALFPPSHSSGELLFLAKLPNRILQCLHGREPQGCGSGVEASKLPGQRGNTLTVTVRRPRRSSKSGSHNGRNLRHEAIYHPAESGLEGARSGGKIGGKGHACDIGVARGIDTYASAIVDVISTQVARVKKGRAGGVQLADKASLNPPPKVVWKASEVIGKSEEVVLPVT